MKRRDFTSNGKPKAKYVRELVAQFKYSEINMTVKMASRVYDKVCKDPENYKDILYEEIMSNPDNVFITGKIQPLTMPSEYDGEEDPLSKIFS